MSNDFFDRAKTRSQERMTERTATAYEETVVTYLLASFKFKVAKTSKELRQFHADRVGVADLTLDAFCRRYESFPLELGASRLGGIRLHTDPNSLLPALFKRMGAAPFVEAYDDFYERTVARGCTRLPALVFPRKGIPHGLVVYASKERDPIALAEHETILTYVGGDKGKKERTWLTIRSLQKLVESLYAGGHGWSALHAG